MLSVHLWARININIIRLLWKIPERDYNQRFLRRRTGEKKKREINGRLSECSEGSEYHFLSTHCQALSQSKQVFHFTASSPYSRAMGRSWKERGFWKLVKWREGFSIGVWERTQWNLISCYHKHHFPFHPLHSLCFPPRPPSKGSSGQVCGVTAPGVGAVSVKMMLPGWAHGWCTQQLQKASADAGSGLCPRSAVSWPRSTSAGNPCSSLNSSQTLVLALELCSHPFCCESCFSIFALLQISTMYGLGTKKSNDYRLKINPSP